MLEAAGLRSGLRQHRRCRCSTPCGAAAEVLAVELSQFPAALGAVAAARGRCRAQCRRGPSGLARLDGRLRRATRPGCSTGRVAVVGLDDPVAAGLLADATAPVRAGFRLGVPGAGRAGGARTARSSTTRSADERASWRDRGRSPVAGPPACWMRWPRRRWPGRSASTRRASPMRCGDFTVGRHRAALVARASTASRYVDDSKATNPHAARPSIAAYPRVVWIAGGLLKGASVDDSSARWPDRLAGAVLIGARCALIAEALCATRPGCPRRRACDEGGFGCMGRMSQL